MSPRVQRLSSYLFLGGGFLISCIIAWAYLSGRIPVDWLVDQVTGVAELNVAMIAGILLGILAIGMVLVYRYHQV